MSQDATRRQKRNVAFKEASEIEFTSGDDLSKSRMPATDPIKDDETGGSGATSASTTEPRIPKGPLENEIREYMITTGEKGRDDVFLPRNALEELLSEERITEALARALSVGSHSRTQTLGADPSPIDISSSDQLAKRKEIVTILILIGKLEATPDFITEGIDDDDLPFERKRSPGAALGKTLKRRDSNGSLKSINLFSSWESRDLEAFEAQQFKIHVPVFSDIGSNTKTPPHWSLATRTVLPYLHSTPVGRGGFSAVSRVELHPAHYDGAEGMPKYYAVKKLMDSSEDAFQEEVSNLRRFSHKDHPHLIRLLWTFSRGSDYHLVFPCAKGNLMGLWEAHPQPLAREGDPSAARWVATQCLGIAQALCMIHQDTDHASSSGGTNKRHGRHGDLKPENILWFDSAEAEKSGDRRGVLTISDFGLADFHDTHSKSRINLRLRKVGMSRTYRAPEYDIHEEIAQNYDIWSLACVLLEFLMWYLKGWEEVQKFSKARQEEHSKSDFQEDTFFNYVFIGGGDGQRQTAAQAKQSVYKAFQELYDDRKASDFSNDLLDFIVNRLLRMNPKQRASCTEVEAAFQKIHDDCESSDDYCLRRDKEPLRRRTTGLSLLEPVAVDVPKEKRRFRKSRTHLIQRVMSHQPEPRRRVLNPVRKRPRRVALIA
ncbi:hypothetical protein ACHAPT_005482 [Fusarium lateritium]